jgi:hypothetical protein
MTRLHKRSVFRPRLIQPPSPDDTRGATPERMRHAQGFIERGNLGRGRTGIHHNVEQTPARQEHFSLRQIDARQSPSDPVIEALGN